MATLSILSYIQPQRRLNMHNDSDSHSGSPPTDGENSAPSGNRPATISLSKTFKRITMQNVLSESSGNALNISNNNNVNTIVRKIKDFGMFGSVNGITGSASSLSTGALTITARKRSASELKQRNEKKSATTTTTISKKLKLSPNETTPKSSKKLLDAVQRIKSGGAANAASTPLKKPAGTPGRKGLPLPQAVARRNARERNRVKQVNNGFTALRDRIPEEVAEAFEAQGNGRGTVKKLSKVETLRMAVEYIRSLERMLGFNFPVGSDRGLTLGPCSNDGDDSFTLIKDEFDALSPPLEDNFDDTLSNYDDIDEYLNDSHVANQTISQRMEPDMEPHYELDMLPSITTLNGLQYIRIPGTYTYQLLTPDIFVGNSNSPPNSSIDDEPFNTLIDTNCLSPVASATSAEAHSSPPSITNSMTTTAANAPAVQQQLQQQARLQHPAAEEEDTLPQMQTSNGERCIVNVAVTTLSRSSPVPGPVTECVPQMQTSSTSSSSSPSRTANAAGSSLQQQQQLPAMLSPACNNELLLQACADARRFVLPTTTHLLPLHANTIKQEQFNDDNTATDFIPMPNSPAPLIYPGQANEQDQQQQQQQQQQQLMLGHAPLSMSPPLERCHAPMTIITAATANTQTGLQAFYEHEQGSSFYEGAVSTFKEEHSDVLLEGVAASGAASCTPTGLSDESMIEVIDWWEAHTPKSDSNAGML